MFLRNALLTALLALVPAVVGRQQPFQAGHNQYDEGLFNPVGDLNALSELTYTTLSHPEFPKYGVRIKKNTDFCDSTVTSYTGYIDVEARHLFFYFFESRRNPDEDDVIFWTSGGPGGSSAFGLFMELGPCRPNANGSDVLHHPESWNSLANVFFIDQPVGVGFSYADHGEIVHNTEEAAQDIAAFVAVFFEHFVKFKGRPFHMAGESYGGRYIPLFAAAVYDQNAKLSAAGLTPVNLKSIMIGNGDTDFNAMKGSYFDITCTPASVAPVLDVATCVRMKQTRTRCLKMLKESCIDIFDSISCAAAGIFCDTEQISPYVESGMNPYDITKKCGGEVLEAFCYPITKRIIKYLSIPQVRKKIGVDPSLSANFSLVNMDLNADFVKNLDDYRFTQNYVAALLERGVKVLIYVGKNDFVCNHVGNEAFTKNLEWTGHDAFNAQPLEDWYVGGKVAGQRRSANGLSFVTLEGAGHMVPYDKPVESLEMVQRWLNGEI